MKAYDWRGAGTAEITPLYDAEVARWMATLHWDTRGSWTLVEAARAAGSLPGFVVRDAQGRIRGWTFYLRHDDAIQVGALSSESPQATAALLDAIVSSTHAASASAVVVFTFSIAPGLTAQLKHRGFAVERYRYMQAALKGCATHRAEDRGDGVARAFRPASWKPGDHRAVAALLASAYPSPDPARPFARHGEAHEWADYVRQLVTTGGCGLFLPDVSLVVRGGSPERFDAAALMTRLSHDTVHLAQLAVSPDARGCGLGRRLLNRALDAAAGAGYARATLLVGERNLRARHLYDQLGFQEAAVFVSAVGDQPRRLTRAALDTGGAITLR